MFPENQQVRPKITLVTRRFIVGTLELSSQLLKTSSHTQMILSQVMISCLFTLLRELGADWLALAIL